MAAGFDSWNPDTIEDSLRIAEVAEKWVSPIGQLLSLLVLSHCGITSVKARIADKDEVGPEKYVMLRFPQATVRTVDEDPELSPLGCHLDMLATRTVLKEKGVDLNTLLSAFIDLRESSKLSDALSHFLDSQARAERGDVDEALRCLFNAFENLHSACFEGTVEDSEELKTVLQELISNAPLEHRGEVSQRLDRKRPKPIKHMLQDLVDICGETASRVLTPRPGLVERAGAARNEIAHSNPMSASRWQRHLVLMDLQWLMRHAFLQQLGILPSDCDDIFRQVGRPFSQYVGHQ
ncbi:HEPN domain-containing protein [Candidatus Poriferisocius sp.]|uniref:HEPN domain-containing protein n=1 Tax=Candidatus Poriferisocius sp. TaxID=3101276 RepID=UPI003B0210D4